MSNLEGAVNAKSRTSAGLLLGLLPLAGMLAACGGGGGAGVPGNDPTDPLIVLAATPTNSQETQTDLSDPGLGGKLIVNFTSFPRGKDLFDPTNSFNGLTPNVQILNQGFFRVPGTPGRGDPALGESPSAFTFTPAGGTLVNAQYTATFSRFIASSAGQLLNMGQKDFSTSWTVGPDIYPPVVRNTSPANLLSDVSLFQPIVVTFNESLDPASVVLNQTVFVEDGGTNPPTALLGTLKLDRDGFDLVFTPDPCTGMPPSTTIVVRMYAFDNISVVPVTHTTYVKDRIGNTLMTDPNTPGEWDFQFNTKGTKPLPIAATVPNPGYPRLQVFTGPLASTPAYASTGNETWAFDSAPVMHDFAVNFTFIPALTVPVLAANRTWKLTAAGWVFVGPFGGDFQTRLGQAGEAVVDWRFDGTTGHTYIYQIDEAKEAVAIINTGTGKVEGHLNGIGTPKGISINGPGSTGVSASLFVTNYGQATVTAIPISTIVPGQPICTAVKELEDDISKRKYMQTGRNPSGVACEFFGLPLGALVNQLDNDMQVFDLSTLQPVDRLGLGTTQQHYPVGENPLDVCWSPYIPGVGIFNYVVAQGGDLHPNGSFSLWFNSTSIGPFAATSGAVQGTIEEGLNIPGHPISDPLALSCFVPNTAGSDVVRVDITIQGGGIFVTAQPKVTASMEIGQNPTKMTWTGFFGRYVAMASLAGEGRVVVWERNAGIISDLAFYNLPGVKSVFSSWDQ